MKLTVEDVLKIYRSGSDIARALGVSRAAVSIWRKRGLIPEKYALRLMYEVAPEKFGVEVRRNDK